MTDLERAKELDARLVAEKFDVYDPRWEARWEEIVAAAFAAVRAEALEEAARRLDAKAAQWAETASRTTAPDARYAAEHIMSAYEASASIVRSLSSAARKEGSNHEEVG